MYDHNGDSSESSESKAVERVAWVESTCDSTVTCGVLVGLWLWRSAEGMIHTLEAEDARW